MIVQILVAQGQRINSLRYQFLHAVLNSIQCPVVGEATSQSSQDACATFYFSQQQTPPVRGNLSAIEPLDYSPRKYPLKLKLRLATLRHRLRPFSLPCKHLVALMFMPDSAALRTYVREKWRLSGSNSFVLRRAGAWSFPPDCCSAPVPDTREN